LVAAVTTVAQSRTVTRTGCLLYRESRFILQDDETREVVELSGPDLDLNTGNHVEITGAASQNKPVVNIATQLINVSAVSPRSPGGCLTVASLLGASANAPRRPEPAKRGASPKGR
jgi:hypothetical protein